MDTSIQTSSTGMSDLINATKGQALNTGALVQANQNLVTQATAQATNSGNLVTQTTNLVTQSTNLVTQTTNLVTQATNQVTATNNLTTAINNALSLGPWGTWSPTVTSNTGTITTLGTVEARYAQAGKTVYFNLNITITTNGTAAGWINATLPLTAKSVSAFSGMQIPSGKALASNVNNGSSSATIVLYDATYPGGNGVTLVVSGVYEAQ